MNNKVLEQDIFERTQFKSTLSGSNTNFFNSNNNWIYGAANNNQGISYRNNSPIPNLSLLSRYKRDKEVLEETIRQNFKNQNIRPHNIDKMNIDSHLANEGFKVQFESTPTAVNKSNSPLLYNNSNSNLNQPRFNNESTNRMPQIEELNDNFTNKATIHRDILPKNVKKPQYDPDTSFISSIHIKKSPSKEKKLEFQKEENIKSIINIPTTDEENHLNQSNYINKLNLNRYNSKVGFNNPSMSPVREAYPHRPRSRRSKSPVHDENDLEDVAFNYINNMNYMNQGKPLNYGMANNLAAIKEE
eukprot:CAMPEP_0170523508 /NCGR_PEP_ID=MMETSP0209-20121228/8903_1 /TAXON_ID=665100 ORGANISM="Litonotus pictus, Strain P1" /NCGR_SAMPLE_ID=MMETSP0209 /ASSEMBLY_ACC=CAM_ASM_000301 /LENGTH=301 /DNA_ID=CAMNT_0010811601 /DNA_START=18 /DNA_END=920 /DNA_ORIENTATION=-